MNTTITIQRWGNSQGIRLTKTILAGIGASVGDTLEVSEKSNILTVRPKTTKLEELSLSQVLNTMPKDYNTQEHDSGAPVGKEVW